MVSMRSHKPGVLPRRVVGVLCAMVLGTVGLAMIPSAKADNDNAQAVPLDEAMSVSGLLELCRDGSAEASIGSDIDPNAIIQRRELARAACDRLIDDSNLEGRDRVEALLARADLLAPGQDDAYERALADYARAIALAPDLATAYWQRGKAHLLYLRDLPAALHNLNEAIRLDPAQAEFFVTRASIRSWLGHPDIAMADLDHALSLDPLSVHALTNRGLAYSNAGDISRALADFDEAIRLAPHDRSLYLFRSASRRQAGDEAGALADDARAAALEAGNGQ